MGKAGWWRVLWCLGLTAACLVAAVSSIRAEETSRRPLKLSLPARPQARRAPGAGTHWIENTLLIMPYKPGSEDALDLIKEVNGTITKTIGQAEMTVWVVTFESAPDFAKAERKLTGDKQIRAIQRDYYLHSTATTNDPYFSQLWHLGALNVPNAWDLSLGNSNVKIGVIDTGVTPTNTELSGKLDTGYNSVTHFVGQTDPVGHGTMVSTSAAAIGDNSNAGVGPARLSRIFPVQASSTGSFSDSALLEAIDYIGNNTTCKLINMSLNGTPPYTLANAGINSVLHTRFSWFHDTKGGLIFNAAGNDALEDTNTRWPYLIVVSAINESYSLTSFSNYGNPIWFTAPGQHIFCTRSTNSVVSVSGTSFASPLACSIAALIWGANQGLTNVQVENIMKAHTSNSGPGWNKFYGYGLPDAAACVADALGSGTPPPPPPPPPPPAPEAPPKKKKKNPNKLWKR